MRLLTRDDESAQRAVREMEKRGFVLSNVEQSGAHDMSASEFFEALKRERNAKRWRYFFHFVGWLVGLAMLLILF